jgi:hypothetical protein
MDVELLPQKVVVTFKKSITLKTEEGSKTFDGFSIFVDNNLYELTSIATSIMISETKTGDTEVKTYMNYYHDLKVEKKKQSDGSKVFILTDIVNGNDFRFATRTHVKQPYYNEQQNKNNF